MSVGALRLAQRSAPAKLNLYLDVKGRRADGYHELETVFVPIDLCDEVQVQAGSQPGQGIALAVTGPHAADVPAGAENLAVRAAQAALDAAGPLAKDMSLSLRLLKRIPAGAGLGGGSSDAAAVLRALALLLAPAAGAAALDAPQLRRLAGGLGADVPFFLGDGAAVGRGRGDVLTWLPAHPPLTFVLCLAPFACATARVFEQVARGMRAAPEAGLEETCAALQSGDVKRLRAAHFNALALPALRAYPQLLRLARDAEVRLGRPLALSGSGSTLYDIVEPQEAQTVMDALAGLPGTRVLVRT